MKGFVQEKSGKYYLVLDLYDERGRRKIIIAYFRSDLKYKHPEPHGNRAHTKVLDVFVDVQ